MKLTLDQKLNIFYLYTTGSKTQAALAKLYFVSQPTISIVIKYVAKEISTNPAFAVVYKSYVDSRVSLTSSTKPFFTSEEKVETDEAGFPINKSLSASSLSALTRGLPIVTSSGTVYTDFKGVFGAAEIKEEGKTVGY